MLQNKIRGRISTQINLQFIETYIYVNKILEFFIKRLHVAWIKNHLMIIRKLISDRMDFCRCTQRPRFNDFENARKKARPK
jgi:hypothetical protein